MGQRTEGKGQGNGSEAPPAAQRARRSRALDGVRCRERELRASLWCSWQWQRGLAAGSQCSLPRRIGRGGLALVPRGPTTLARTQPTQTHAHTYRLSGRMVAFPGRCLEDVCWVLRDDVRRTSSGWRRVWSEVGQEGGWVGVTRSDDNSPGPGGQSYVGGHGHGDGGHGC